MPHSKDLWQLFNRHILAAITLLLLLFFSQTTIVASKLQIWTENQTDVEPVTNSSHTPLIQQTPMIVDLSKIPNGYNYALAPYPHLDTFVGEKPTHGLQTYVVQKGDTPSGIAEQFNLKQETILGGNPSLSQESSLLQVGTELLILPTDGVLHTVQRGESLDSIANQYGIAVSDIVAFESNKLTFPFRVYPDTQLIIPGAIRELFVWTPPTLPEVAKAGKWWDSKADPIIYGTGTFIWPISARYITQYYWYGHRAIDVGLPERSNVYASDTGTVVYAGWNIYGYGNLVVINHGNGYETFYAHLSGFNVGPGQIVYQGNIVGFSGNTGNSSGPHIHFEIRNGGSHEDPMWYLP